ncbi:MAG: Na+/H+ antiporter subunit E [Butyrivibrio sp.]|nr:Na+/H+ antiporter subunit E [Butyrivibrio sp.]
MGILFFIFWIILNGRVTPEICIFGVVISFFVYLFAYKFLDYSPKLEWRIFKKLPLVLAYVFVLIREIITSSIRMAGCVFNHRDIFEPAIVHFRSPLRTEFAMYILAASITMTPGTIVVRLRDGEYQVHCFDREMAKDIDSSDFVRLLQKMEAG